MYVCWQDFCTAPQFIMLTVQGSTLTFQLPSQVASDILGVTKISVCLLAKLGSGNRKPPTKTEFLLVCGQWATVSVEPCYSWIKKTKVTQQVALGITGLFQNNAGLYRNLSVVVNYHFISICYCFKVMRKSDLTLSPFDSQDLIFNSPLQLLLISL